LSLGVSDRPVWQAKWQMFLVLFSKKNVLPAVGYGQDDLV
jgi:hypothetical protein